MWSKVVNTSGHEDPNPFPEYTGSLGVRDRSPKQGGIAHHDDAQKIKRFFDWVYEILERDSFWVCSSRGNGTSKTSSAIGSIRHLANR